MIEELGPDNSSGLALLAWHELVEEAEKELPLLVNGKQILRGDALVKKLTAMKESLLSIKGLHVEEVKYSGRSRFQRT